MNYVESVRLEKPISYLNDRDPDVLKPPPKPKENTMSGYCSRCGETICICEDIVDESPVNLLELLDDCNKSYTQLNEITQRLLVRIEDLTKRNSQLDAYALADSETISDQSKRIAWLEYIIWKAATNNTNEDWQWWDYEVKPILKVVEDRLNANIEPHMNDNWYENI